MLQPNLGVPMGGAYWLRNTDGGFAVIPLGPVTQGTAGKVVVIRPPLPSTRDTAAFLLSDGELHVWSPSLPDAGLVPAGGYAHILDGGGNRIADITAAQLTGWAAEGLITTYTVGNISEVAAYELIATGRGSFFNSPIMGRDWASLAGWKQWVPMSQLTGTIAAHFGVLNSAGTFIDAGTTSIPIGWSRGQAIDLLGDSKFFVQTTNDLQIWDTAFGAPPPTSFASGLKIDGGSSIPYLSPFVIGNLGTSGLTLVSLTVTGGARQFSNFTKVGIYWFVDEVKRADLNDAGVVFTQGVIADLTGDSKNDLVLVDQSGTLRIYPSP